MLVALSLCGALLWSADEPQRRGVRPTPSAGPAPKPVAVFAGFPDWVASVAFSPDGRLLAAGSSGVVKLFDVAEKSEIASLAEPAGMVKSLAFSPDGATLVSGSYQAIAMWDVTSHQLTRRLKGHRGQVTGIAFAPGGKLFATSSEDETVRYWDPASGDAKQVLSGLGQPALGLAFSNDGQSLAVCTGDATRPTKKGAVRVYDASGELRHTFEGHERVVSAVTFGPDGTTLISGGADETIRVWNLADGKEVRKIEGQSRPVNGLALVPGGKWLASAGGGRNAGGNDVKLWELATGKERATIPAHEGPVMQVALSSDGRLLASGGYDRTVKLWDAAVLLGEAPPQKPKEEPQVAQAKTEEPAAGEKKTLRIGMIGLDTSHSVEFTKVLNASDAAADIAGCKVVAAYPRGSADIESSAKRIPQYTIDVQKLGVEIVDSIEALLPKVDVVLLETNDGRPHFDQALQVLKAKKPVFIDKPIAGSLTDAVAIFEAAKKYQVPVFSSSSMRFLPGPQAIRGGKIGEVKGCDAYSTCSLEKTHPDFFWYGIHGVESLFTCMGTGCESVSRVSTPGIDVAVGTWNGGRVGTFRGIRASQGGGREGHGGTAFGTRGVEQLGSDGGYRPMLVEIVKFFHGGKTPVAEEETIEIYAFMEAADESKRQGGAPVKIETVLAKAREAAKLKLDGN